jgi:hypothetical protein
MALPTPGSHFEVIFASLKTVPAASCVSFGPVNQHILAEICFSAPTWARH